jgi:hypothetical protein
MPRADTGAAGYGLRPKLALAALLALAGCGTAIQQCAGPDATLSTRGAALALPDGCRAVRTGTDGFVTLACEGGRVGYAFDSLASNSQELQ